MAPELSPDGAELENKSQVCMCALWRWSDRLVALSSKGKEMWCNGKKISRKIKQRRLRQKHKCSKSFYLAWSRRPGWRGLSLLAFRWCFFSSGGRKAAILK